MEQSLVKTNKQVELCQMSKKVKTKQTKITKKNLYVAIKKISLSEVLNWF